MDRQQRLHRARQQKIRNDRILKAKAKSQSWKLCTTIALGTKYRFDKYMHALWHADFNETPNVTRLGNEYWDALKQLRNQLHNRDSIWYKLDNDLIHRGQNMPRSMVD